MVKVKKELEVGDYVLGTLFSDGSPKDPWAVGFVQKIYVGRKIIVDSSGKPFRTDGFRRCESISARVGKLIVDNTALIEQCDRSLWWWRRNAKKLEGEHTV